MPSKHIRKWWEPSCSIQISRVEVCEVISPWCEGSYHRHPANLDVSRSLGSFLQAENKENIMPPILAPLSQDRLPRVTQRDNNRKPI